MRLSEIRGLRWREIDLNAKRITLPETRAKNKSERIIPLPEHVAAMLAEHGRVRRFDTDLLFPGRDSADGIKPLKFRTVYETALKIAKLDGVNFHTLRHTALSVAAMSGANTRELMDYGGHKSVATSARYQHLAADHVADLAERVSRQMFWTER